jgi:hypothetical protein
VIAFVGEEWGNSGSLTWGIIVGKFGKREKGGPVVLLVVAIAVKVLLEGLVDAFCLTITFRIITGSEV